MDVLGDISGGDKGVDCFIDARDCRIHIDRRIVSVIYSIGELRVYVVDVGIATGRALNHGWDWSTASRESYAASTSTATTAAATTKDGRKSILDTLRAAITF